MARTLEYALAAATRLESFCRFLSFAGPRSGAASGGWTRGRRSRADAMRIFPSCLPSQPARWAWFRSAATCGSRKPSVPAVSMSALVDLALLVAAVFIVRHSFPVPGQLGTAPLSVCLGGAYGAL